VSGLTAVDTPEEDAIFPAIFSSFQIEMNACEFIVFSVFSGCESGVGSVMLYHLRTRRCVVAKGGPQSIFVFVAGVVLSKKGHATFGTNGSSACVLEVLIQVIMHTMRSTQYNPARRAISHHTVHTFQT
jgi:hypothetical protein